MSKAEIEFAAESTEKMDDLISRRVAIEAISVDGFEHFSGCLSSSEATLIELLRDTISEIPAVTAEPVVHCEHCIHQRKFWFDDRRMKEKGYYVYQCAENKDPFVAHVVNGKPGEFCCKGNRKPTTERWGRSLGYSTEPCPKCGRVRLEQYQNGKQVCEKCEWCPQDQVYVDRYRMYEFEEEV